MDRDIFTTMDGYEAKVGDRLFVRHGNGDVEICEVAEIVTPKRVRWTHEDSHGYVGARWNITYRDADAIPTGND